jgi:NDP-sugar pyrophosphorylase family protein
MKQAVIIAAGRGAKLGALTRDRPKPMLPVLGKPVVARIMDRMREVGISQFIVVVGEDEGEVASYLSGGWAADAKVQIVLQPTSRGPADALASAANYITGSFIVSSCDHLVPRSHIELLARRLDDTKADMVLSLSPYGREQHLPVVNVEGDYVTSIGGAGTQKHSLASFLVYACSKRVLNYTGQGSVNDSEMSGLIQALLGAGGRVSYANAEWHMPLTREVDLLSINRRFLREGRDTHILSEIPGSVQIIPPVRIDPQVSVGQNAKIGPNVYLESGSKVGQAAVLWDTMVLNKAEIASEEVAHDQIVLRQERIQQEPDPEKTLPLKPTRLKAYLDGMEGKSDEGND